MTTFIFGFIITMVWKWRSLARVLSSSINPESRADSAVLLVNDLAFVVLLTQMVTVASVYIIDPLAFIVRVFALLIVYMSLKNMYNSKV